MKDKYNLPLLPLLPLPPLLPLLVQPSAFSLHPFPRPLASFSVSLYPLFLKLNLIADN